MIPIFRPRIFFLVAAFLASRNWYWVHASVYWGKEGPSEGIHSEEKSCQICWINSMTWHDRDSHEIDKYWLGLFVFPVDVVRESLKSLNWPTPQGWGNPSQCHSWELGQAEGLLRWTCGLSFRPLGLWAFEGMFNSCERFDEMNGSVLRQNQYHHRPHHLQWPCVSINRVVKGPGTLEVSSDSSSAPFLCACPYPSSRPFSQMAFSLREAHRKSVGTLKRGWEV